LCKIKGIRLRWNNLIKFNKYPKNLKFKLEVSKIKWRNRVKISRAIWIKIKIWRNKF